MKKNHLVNYIVSAASLVSIKRSFLDILLAPPGERVRVRGRLIVGLLLCMLTALVGCGNLPFAKKPLPPQTQLEPPYEPPPTPLEPGPGTKPAPQTVYAPSGSTVSDTRLADLASQFEALRARLQVVEGKLAEQENQLNQWSRSGNPQETQMREKLTALERDLAAAQERLARLEGGASFSNRQSRTTPCCPSYAKFLLPRQQPKPEETSSRRG